MIEAQISESAITDLIKKFLFEFRENNSYKYVQQIDQMMSKNSKYITIDYNDLVLHQDIESRFRQNPDEMLTGFSKAIKEILQMRFTNYAKKNQR